ncbi:MAG TPA: replication initiator [Acidimicrobiales bacterium]|nr:replication initiator [Acidimicrobiales bacterium]
MTIPEAWCLDGELHPQLVADFCARTPTYERWLDQVSRTGYCSQPVRLSGWAGIVDRDSGKVRARYSTLGEPDGCLYKACNQRRASLCPGCSATYQGDAFQLLAAGLRGGKGVPESVAAHPALFVTFTAPSFGPVHARRERHGSVLRCRPRRDETCPHGRRLDCRVRHGADDEVLGQPLCPACFDYERAVIWNARAPELWRRTTIYLRRALARATGMTTTALRRLVRLSYAKVVEYQRRGLIHVHAVIRLDGAGEDCEAPPAAFTVELLEHALRAAAAAVSAPAPAADGSATTLRWGSQLDVRVIAAPASLSRGAVAGYVAKYATKSTDPLGRLDRRLMSLADLEGRGVEGHVKAMAETAWRLGELDELEGLKLRRWAHNLGFGGHWMTKSRRYSTTFGALRGARATWAARERDGIDDDRGGEHAGQRVGEWQFVGVGFERAGDRLLAASAAAWAREQRRIAREELAVAA